MLFQILSEAERSFGICSAKLRTFLTNNVAKIHMAAKKAAVELLDDMYMKLEKNEGNHSQ